MTTHVLLLRGINVGGKNKLPMADLRALLADLGAANVATYIQSGNAVIDLPAKAAKTFPERVRDGIAERFDLHVPVVMLRGKDFLEIAAAHPFDGDDVPPKSLHVALLEQKPKKAATAALDPDRSPGDRFVVEGRALYLHFPNGVARTKLTNAYLDRTLGMVTTLRNWRSMGKLRDMVEAR